MAERVVRTFGEFSAAVTDANVDVIILGENIQMASGGVVIPAGKTSLTFNGEYGGVVHTLTDVNTILATDTLRVEGTSSISLTFEHMHMIGRNYYGIPCIYEDPNTSGVTVTYRDVTYQEPQMVFHPNGLTVFEDCNVTISYPAETGRVQEIGEVNRVEFKGTNTFNHLRTPIITYFYAAFWFRGATGSAYFRVHPDAVLTIYTANYLMFSMTPAGAPLNANPVTYDIQPGASFTLTSYRGISYDNGHRASSFLVDTGATFRYYQQAANLTNASLYIDGNFTVRAGATVYMQSDFANSQAFIEFYLGTAPLELNVNNPKSFVMYSRTNPAIRFRSGATRMFSFVGEQLNHWTAPRAFPIAGGFGDIAQNRWHNPNWAVFTVSGTANSTGTSATSSGLDNPATIGNFSFQSGRVISSGNILIVPDPIIDNGRPITGRTEPNATLIISFNIGGTEYSSGEFAADGDGRFVYDPGIPIPVGTVVAIGVNTPFLIKEITQTTVPTGEVTLVSSPDSIAFIMPPVATSPVLLRRAEPVEPVKVLDTRPYPTEWKLRAAITGPLHAATGEVLNDAVVYRDEDEILWNLGGEPVVVHTGGPVTGETDVVWDAGRGILVRVTEPIRSGARYTTQLMWDLEVIEEP